LLSSLSIANCKTGLFGPLEISRVNKKDGNGARSLQFDNDKAIGSTKQLRHDKIKARNDQGAACRE